MERFKELICINEDLINSRFSPRISFGPSESLTCLHITVIACLVLLAFLKWRYSKKPVENRQITQVTNLNRTTVMQYQ